MHLRVIVNGTIDHVQKWKNDLAAVWLPYEHKKGEKINFQMGVRTIEMVDLCFPEESLDLVMSLVQPVTGMYVDDGNKRYPWLERGLKWMRKFMNMTEVPTKEYPKHPMNKNEVAVNAIGLKQDLYEKDGIEIL